MKIIIKMIINRVEDKERSKRLRYQARISPFWGILIALWSWTWNNTEIGRRRRSCSKKLSNMPIRV